MDLEKRNEYIGGSDAAGVLGLSRWKTPLQIWAEKTGQIEPKDLSDSLPCMAGKYLEELVAKIFEKRIGKKVRCVNETIYHQKYPFLAANIDRKVVGEDAILECKTTFENKDWKDDDIPQEYILQCLHYLAVTRYKKCYIAVLVKNREFLCREINRDERMLQNIVSKEVDFWNNFVIPKVMPLQVLRQDDDVLYKLFPQEIEGKQIELPEEIIKIVESIEALKEDKRSLEAIIEKQENEVKIFLKDNELSENDFYKITWKSQSRKTLDTKRVKEEMPDLYNNFLTENKTRVLRIVNKKEK